jgi:hypothetical protein
MTNPIAKVSDQQKLSRKMKDWQLKSLGNFHQKV